MLRQFITSEVVGDKQLELAFRGEYEGSLCVDLRDRDGLALLNSDVEIGESTDDRSGTTLFSGTCPKLVGSDSAGLRLSCRFL
jgi:hypothetical protein